MSLVEAPNPDLPQGTITFLLTDIEGSARIWESSPSEMMRAIARHHAIFEESVGAHLGHLPRDQGEGDGRCAVLSRATDAAECAVAIQRALAAEPWPTPTPIRVRMGLHTGEAETREGNYFGSAVNRCGRLRSLGHGGQILVSETTAYLVQDSLPEGAWLIDLGLHRLRDFDRPEHVFQLNHKDLPTEFPPLHSLEVIPNNLPLQMSSLVGRDEERAGLPKLLAESRLVTLTGPGGVGKTRLALTVASAIFDLHPDGVWLADLGPVNQPELVPSVLASTLGMREEPGRDILHSLRQALVAKHVLILLDGCEHLLDSCAETVATLLRSCEGLTVMATSREPLGVPGEAVYRLEPLRVPSEEVTQAEALLEYEAVRLFVERARLAKTDFAPSDEGLAAVAQICRRLDGIPLALELGAARVRTFTPQQILTRLDDRFRLLSGGDRTALARQQTLRALIDWSYDILSPPEQALLRRLSAFAGGCFIEAAEEVCDAQDLPNADVLDSFPRLVDKSLLAVEEYAGESRYSMLETIRDYAHERLVEAGEESQIRERHLRWFLHFAASAERELHGSNQGKWLDRLEVEHDNLRTALSWSISTRSNEAASRMATALAPFWITRGYLSEGRTWTARILEMAEEDPDLRAKVLNTGGALAWYQGDYPVARCLYEEALGIRRELHDQKGVAELINNLGILAHEVRDYEEAEALYQESLLLRRELGSERSIAEVLSNLGTLAADRGEYQRARTLLAEALGIYETLGDRLSAASCFANLGVVADREGAYDDARRRYEQALEVRRELGDLWGVANSLGNLGEASCSLGDLEGARSLFEEARRIQEELGDRAGIAHSLHGLGTTARQSGEIQRAHELLAEALHIHRDLEDKEGMASCLEELGLLAAESDGVAGVRLLAAAHNLREIAHIPQHGLPRDRHERALHALRSRLGEDAFATAWTKAMAIGPEEVMGTALCEPT